MSTYLLSLPHTYTLVAPAHLNQHPHTNTLTDIHHVDITHHAPARSLLSVSSASMLRLRLATTTAGSAGPTATRGAWVCVEHQALSMCVWTRRGGGRGRGRGHRTGRDEEGQGRRESNTGAHTSRHLEPKHAHSCSAELNLDIRQVTCRRGSWLATASGVRRAKAPSLSLRR